MPQGRTLPGWQTAVWGHLHLCTRTPKGRHGRARRAEKGVPEKLGFLNLSPASLTTEASGAGWEDPAGSGLVDWFPPWSSGRGAGHDEQRSLTADLQQCLHPGWAPRAMLPPACPQSPLATVLAASPQELSLSSGRERLPAQRQSDAVLGAGPGEPVALSQVDPKKPRKGAAQMPRGDGLRPSDQELLAAADPALH